MDEPNEQVETQEPSSETVTETSPPSPAPTTPPTEQQPQTLNSAQEAMLRIVAEANRRAEEAEQRARQLEQQRNAPPPPSDDDLNKQYYENPAAFIRQQLREQLDSTVGPLNQWRQTFTKEQKYAQVKAQIRGSLQHFAGLEQYIDQIIANAPAEIDVTPQVVQQAYVNALGWATANNLYNPYATPPAPTEQPTNTQTQQPTVTTPPHRPPSPPAPPKAPSDKRRALTENERRLMREYGMNEQQWWEYMDMDAASVANGGSK